MPIQTIILYMVILLSVLLGAVTGYIGAARYATRATWKWCVLSLLYGLGQQGAFVILGGQLLGQLL